MKYVDSICQILKFVCMQWIEKKDISHKVFIFLFGSYPVGVLPQTGYKYNTKLVAIAFSEIMHIRNILIRKCMEAGAVKVKTSRGALKASARGKSGQSQLPLNFEDNLLRTYLHLYSIYILL